MCASFTKGAVGVHDDDGLHFIDFSKRRSSVPHYQHMKRLFALLKKRSNTSGMRGFWSMRHIIAASVSDLVIAVDWSDTSKILGFCVASNEQIDKDKRATVIRIIEAFEPRQRVGSRLIDYLFNRTRDVLGCTMECVLVDNPLCESLPFWYKCFERYKGDMGMRSWWIHPLYDQGPGVETGPSITLTRDITKDDYVRMLRAFSDILHAKDIRPFNSSDGIGFIIDMLLPAKGTFPQEVQTVHFCLSKTSPRVPISDDWQKAWAGNTKDIVLPMGTYLTTTRTDPNVEITNGEYSDIREAFARFDIQTNYIL